MTEAFRYRLPDGAAIVSEEDGVVKISVTMPADDSGHLGRQCPDCERMFRINAEDYKALPDDQLLTCPYCCVVKSHSEYMTEQQKQRALAAAGEYAQQLVKASLNDSFKNLAQRSRRGSGGVSITYTASADTKPDALPEIVEESPIRERTCIRCLTRYAIFGEHISCPVCGRLPPEVVSRDALEAQEVALAMLEGLPTDRLDQLRESGALDRTAAGTLGSVVSILEMFLKQIFLDRVVDGDDKIAGKGNVFQRLDDARQLYRDHLSIDFPAALGTSDWDRLCVLYSVRHLHTHTNGVVDAKHAARFPNSVVGKRVSATSADAHEAIKLAQKVISVVP